MAAAFGATFWWALALVVIAFVVAVACSPRTSPSPSMTRRTIAREPEAAAAALVV